MTDDSLPTHADSPNCSPGLDENGLPLPTPFPEYVMCPNCGELEVEVWCYQLQARCHQCGTQFAHTPPICFGTAYCQANQKQP
jgi:hypothetical protein